MSVKIATFEDLRQYAAGVLDRVKDHGPNINTVVYALIAFVIVNADEIKVRGYQGAMGNVLWCRYKGERYAFSYTHDNGGAVVLKRWNLQGPEIGRFTNQSTVEDFLKAFKRKTAIGHTVQQTQQHEVHG